MILYYLLIIIAAFAAGIVNSLAGGGSFLVFPALLCAGLDPRAANMTSTVGLYPMQISTGFSGRKLAGGTPHLSFKVLLIISLLGGIVGAILLLLTSPAFFARLVPWLILFATCIFAWGSFLKKPTLADVTKPHSDYLGKVGATFVQFCISVYGGYFGGGIGLLMLATLTLSGMNLRQAATTKNILAAVMNTSAVGVFLLSPNVHWFKAGFIAIAAISGGLIGVRMLDNINERYLRISVVAIGVVLAIGLFIRAHHQS